MGVVVVMAHGGIVPPRSERVLREVVRANGEEVDVAGDRGDAERGGGRLAQEQDVRILVPMVTLEEDIREMRVLG